VEPGKASRPTAALAANEPRDLDQFGRQIGSEVTPSLGAFQHCILGIDPGLGGALAFFFPATPDKIAAEDMPVAGGDVDGATLAQRIAQLRPSIALLERVASRPGQGVASTFKFGASYGIARGVVQAFGVPLYLVTPTKWKAHFSLTADKELSRALALRLWPSSAHFGRKRDHGRAEAALRSAMAPRPSSGWRQ
jgi:crossover junction endodeoxyribonuclease RuvC